MLNELWISFSALPLWVRLWLMLILAPVNLLTLAFVTVPGGGWIALLALGGMALNLPVMLYDRGFSKAMAFPHLVFWIPLLIVAGSLLVRDVGPPAFADFLWLLVAVDLVSVAFDIRDARDWLRGDRAVPGRTD